MEDDAVQCLRTIVAHRDYVRLALMDITHDLERRALAHDLSKLRPDEFDGFSRINRAAREHPYGSAEYRAGLAAEKATVDLHYSRNSHHPEHHVLRVDNETPPWRSCASEDMGFLDIIEMVCDWRSAYLTYGSQGTWSENLQRQEERYGETFSPAQWWLIEEVAGWLFCQDSNRDA